MTATTNDTESSRLLPAERDGYGSASDCESAPQPEEPKPYSHAFIARVVIALLIGVFTSNADGSLVLATHPVIASEFGDLADSSWLFISFMLAGAASQTVYGKLSDIFGRKAILMFCYGLFALGCALVGIGQSMWQVILGRVISGSGGAGMTAMASVIITDLAPLREVASWQSYMNVIATVGRSIGGPLGGLLADTIGWRWSFLGQAPIFAASMVICGLLLPSTSHGTQESSIGSRLARIDVFGALLLGATVLSLMMPLEIGGQKIPWSHPIIFALFAAGLVLAVAFVFVESRWAKEPIFPLRLLRNAQVTKSYLIVAAQAGAQLGLPNMFRALLQEPIFSQQSLETQLEELLLASLLIESLYVFPGGLGTGIAFSAGFISLQASIDPKDKAAAAAGLFMTTTLGTIIGMAGTSAIIQGYLRYSVQLDLTRLGMSQAEISEVTSESVSYIEHATGAVQKVLIDGYVKGIEYGHGLSIVFAGITLITASLLKERKL
ncbi:hypothetical protein CEP54_004624 [Fusarium duplospermum]|uniref:Major facilitator superfamily (MFS) profile domain-containing protein n=1 Tax=Fusarium duplospermum TaxID=1325734 RepID=A0A428QHK9_9HYPO|nr:hypothetical protein CEP54_004624 [Fusarium duplospermum]